MVSASEKRRNKIHYIGIQNPTNVFLWIYLQLNVFPLVNITQLQKKGLGRLVCNKPWITRWSCLFPLFCLITFFCELFLLFVWPSCLQNINEGFCNIFESSLRKICTRFSFETVKTIFQERAGVRHWDTGAWLFRDSWCVSSAWQMLFVENKQHKTKTVSKLLC